MALREKDYEKYKKFWKKNEVYCDNDIMPEYR